MMNRSTLFCKLHTDCAPMMEAALPDGAIYTGEDKDPMLATEKVPESGGHVED